MRRILPLALFLSLVIADGVLALDTATRVVSPLHNWQAADLARFDTEWLHVKLVEGSDASLQGSRFVDMNGADLSPVNEALAAAGVTQIRPTFVHDRETLRAWKAAGEARSGVTGPDLSLWFDVRVEGGHAAVAGLVNALNAADAVEIAHPVAIPETAVLRAERELAAPLSPREALTPDFTSQQDYLYDPPVGLDAPAVWAHPGGRGASMKFIDVELAWTEDHEDFDTGNYFYHGGATEDPGYEPHGTAVLGEVIGQDNGFGITGFAGDTQYGVVAVTVAEWPNVPHYFQEAVDNLDPGDVWLIELQMYPPNHTATPMEWLQVNYDVIWTSCWALEIVCVEAGANGSQDLDDPSWGGVFDRSIRDSGAIMVGAGTPYGRVAEWFTNWGSRMDVHAWGSAIVTTGYGDLYNGGSLQTRYTDEFGGTSGASPMVTGSALCLQGIAKAQRGEPLAPVDLRALLHDTGVPHLDPTKEIGPRPDLAAAAEQIVDLTAAPETPLATAALLHQNLPNPFNPRTTIRFELATAGHAELAIFDAAGRHVATLLNGEYPVGEHELIWQGRDDEGRPVGSGIYFYRLEAASRSETRKMILLK